MIYKIRKYIILIQLIIVLWSSPVLRGRAEDRIDFKHEDYSEENGRIKIRTTSFLFERDLIPKLTVKGAYVYDGVSGATPTGAPPLPNESEVETTEIKDIRRAGFIAADYQIGSHKLSPQLAYSSESDYKSFGLSLIDSMDFNDKNTTITIGASHDIDRIVPNYGMNIIREKNKDNSQVIVGLTQLINPKTVFTANLTLGYSSGYLDDPYKGVLFDDHYSPTTEEIKSLSEFLSLDEIIDLFEYKDGDPYVLFPENRPSKKFRQVGLLSLTHYIEKLNGSIEGAYRYYHDDFGVNSDTLSLTWRQKIGDQFIVSPSFRFYRQSSADFYNPRFNVGSPIQHPEATPSHYSADFRLSEFDSFTYGVKFNYIVSDNLKFDLSLKRYEMEGKDNKTSPSAYANANIITGGFRVWF
ncbi:MAG: DUF3570 domain-containing protein [Verrucomicrobiota bacterium]|nr:DUF3570 domain-containing protein [Verrucomicrobiota bacterium]